MARITQETIVLNGFEGFKHSKGSIRRRTTSRGTKDRVSIQIEAEPLVHSFDDIALGRGVAEAIRDELERGVKAITKFAKPSTIARRNYSRAALEGGGAPRSVLKRYTGGRIGQKNPKTSARLFNDSDRLSEGLHVRQNPLEGNFTTNVPANRFTDDTQHLVKQLFLLVPTLADPRKLLKAKAVRKEIEESVNLMIVKAKSLNDIQRARLRQARLQAAKAALTLARTLTGV